MPGRGPPRSRSRSRQTVLSRASLLKLRVLSRAQNSPQPLALPWPWPVTKLRRRADPAAVGMTTVALVVGGAAGSPMPCCVGPHTGTTAIGVAAGAPPWNAKVASTIQPSPVPPAGAVSGVEEGAQGDVAGEQRAQVGDVDVPRGADAERRGEAEDLDLALVAGAGALDDRQSAELVPGVAALCRAVEREVQGDLVVQRARRRERHLGVDRVVRGRG